MSWRPIATAPKDGTWLLLFTPDATEPRIYVGAWAEFENYDACWVENYCDDPLPAEPSHWMPLPEPPP